MGASCTRGLPEHGGNMYNEERRGGGENRVLAKPL